PGRGALGDRARPPDGRRAGRRGPEPRPGRRRLHPLLPSSRRPHPGRDPGEAMTGGPRILDIVNTDHAALNFLAYRVGWINRHSEFVNDIVCSPGPHLARLDLEQARVTALDIPRDVSPASLGRLLGRLIGLMRAERYTIVHTHNSITGAVGRLAARLARVPLVLHTTHGFHFHENMSRLRRLPWVAAERWLSRFCDLLLCQNRQ